MEIIVKNPTKNKIIFNQNEIDITSISFDVVHNDEEISSVIGCDENCFFQTYHKIINSENNSVSLSYEEIRIIYSIISYCFNAVGLSRVKEIINKKIPDDYFWECLINELNNLLEQA